MPNSVWITATLAGLLFVSVPAVYEPAFAGPLHDAAKKGNIEQVEQLIAEGADVNQQDRRTGTALHWAALRGDAAVVEVLIAAGADVNAVSKDNGGTPLHAAASAGHASVAEVLLAKGADIEAFTSSEGGG